MLILAKSALALLIGFITSVTFGYFFIKFLKRVNIRQTVSVFLEERHKKKEGIPTMGGFIFIIPTIVTAIILLFMNKIEFSNNLLIVLFVFVFYALLGFIDDYLIIKRHDNEGLTEIQKLFGQLLIALVFFYIYIKSGNDPHLTIYTLGINIDMGWFYGVFLLFVLLASSNAVNLTDGLDGLAGGLSAIAFLALGIISWGSTGIQGSGDIAVFCFILVGALIGFLMFNTYPAKVFMGDVGSLSLGATLASVAIITSHEITFIVIMGVFIVETLVAIIQQISIIYFHKKIFLMAPLHHHFEKLGWHETDIVKLFWTCGLILSMAAIAFGVWI